MNGVILAHALIGARQTVPHKWDFDPKRSAMLGQYYNKKDQ
ncbi:hypothetical protein ACEYW6_18790 [Nostoc sp. UIC 10607]|nr:hypothetical protein [Nostoc sp. NZL]